MSSTTEQNTPNGTQPSISAIVNGAFADSELNISLVAASPLPRSESQPRFRISKPPMDGDVVDAVLQNGGNATPPNKVVNNGNIFYF